MSEHRQDTPNHVCRLLREPEDLVGTFVDAGLFVSLRRHIRRVTMISPKHPYTKFYASSISKLRHEQRRHLVNSYKMIHPLSVFNFGWDVFMSMLFLITFIVAPVLSPSLDKSMMQKVMSFKTLMQFILIMLSFVTGQYDSQNRRVYLNRTVVAYRYLTSYFLVDVAGIIPAFVRFLIEYNYLDDNSNTVQYVIVISTLIMYGRYFYCMAVFRQIKLAVELSSYTYKAIKVVSHFLIFLLVVMYILYISLNSIAEYTENSFLKNAEFTLDMLLLVSYGNPNATSIFVNILCPMIIIPFGFVLHLLLIIHIMELWLKFFSTENQQNNVYDSIAAYMQYRALPLKFRERVWLYLDFKYQGHFYKDSVIKRATSPFLRKEILLAASMNSIAKVELFQQIPQNILTKLQGHMDSEIYLPGDTIIRAGQYGRSMFFILAGTVKITTPEDKIVCYLRDGAHFGEVALLINIARVANVIAETPCELFKLSRKHFIEVVREYPELYREIRAMAESRLSSSTEEGKKETREAVSQMWTKMITEVDSETDIQSNEFEI